MTSQPSPPPPANGGGLVNLKVLSCFVPAPFLCNAILALDSLSPFALIVAARAAQKEHVRANAGEEDFDEGNVTAHIDLFSLR